MNEGDAFISLGTATQYFVARESYRPAPEQLIHTFCHALPGRWFQMAALLNGAGALAWAAGLMGRPDIGTLLDDTERAFTGPSALLFLPYLSGERTPHNKPQAKGYFRENVRWIAAAAVREKFASKYSRRSKSSEEKRTSPELNNSLPL